MKKMKKTKKLNELLLQEDLHIWQYQHTKEQGVKSRTQRTDSPSLSHCLSLCKAGQARTFGRRARVLHMQRQYMVDSLQKFLEDLH